MMASGRSPGEFASVASSTSIALPGDWSGSGKRGKGSDPLKITAAHRGQSLKVTLENPARSAFSGKIVVRADGENSDGPAVQIGKGHDQTHIRLPLQTGIHQVLLADEQGSVVAQTTAARYQPDATGQTFQPDMGRLDWSGWRPLRIEFGTQSATWRWGGAGDGTPHPPLTWEALPLIDSARRGRSGPQSVLVASPFYVLDR
jgi:hypothetical protein